MICNIIIERDLEQKRKDEYERLTAKGNEMQDDKWISPFLCVSY